MSTVLDPNEGQIWSDVPPITVWTKADWGSDWTLRQYLYPDRVEFASGNRNSEAILHYEYGLHLRPDRLVPLTYLPSGIDYTNPDTEETIETPSLLGHYVKIVIDLEPTTAQQEAQDAGEEEVGSEDITWYGVILEKTQDREGSLLDSEGTRLQTGTEEYRAFGLEVLLERARIQKAFVYREAWNPDTAAGIDYETGRGLTFNVEAADANRGNRAPELLDGEDSYRFFDHCAEQVELCEWWSTKDIVKYLLDRHAPRDEEGEVIVPWFISDRAEEVLPTWDRPVVRTHGRTVRQVLNDLLDRRRLLTYHVYLEVLDSGWTSIKLDVRSCHEDDLDLPSGEVQPGNDDTVTIDPDRALDVRATLVDSQTDKCDQVVARGARKRSIFSLSTKWSDLATDWENDDRVDWDDGPDVTGLDPDKAEAVTLRYRELDRFDRVYRYWRWLPYGTGDARAVAGIHDEAAPTTWYPLFRDSVGDPDADDVDCYVYEPEARFDRTLPKNLLESAPTGRPEDYTRPIGIMKLEDDGSGTDRYAHLESLATDSDNETVEDGGRPFSISLRIRNDAAGVILDVQPSKYRYRIAGDGYTPLDWEITPVLDYTDKIIVTLMLELDQYVEARYPSDDEVAGTQKDYISRVEIELGERCRLDYILPKTVLGIDEDEQLVLEDEADGRMLRDDRDELKDIAKFVHEWYSTDRQAFTFSMQQISKILQIGQFITQIGSGATLQSVHSIVTSIRYSLKRDNVETLVRTAFGELDVQRFLV